MTVVETEAGDPFVGFDHAETRWHDRGVLLLLGAVQLAWLAGLCYLGYVFIGT